MFQLLKKTKDINIILILTDCKFKFFGLKTNKERLKIKTL